MTTGPLFGITGLILFALGLHALFFRPHLVHKIVAGNVAANGVFLVLVHRTEHNGADPVAQAMVLTGIVVSVAITGFAAALANRLIVARGHTDLEEDDQ